MNEPAMISSKNLRYCRAFFRFYCDPAIWQQAVAKLRESPWAGAEAELSGVLACIPWGHNIQIFCNYKNWKTALATVAAND